MPARPFRRRFEQANLNTAASLAPGRKIERLSSTATQMRGYPAIAQEMRFIGGKEPVYMSKVTMFVKSALVDIAAYSPITRRPRGATAICLPVRCRSRTFRCRDRVLRQGVDSSFITDGKIGLTGREYGVGTSHENGVGRVSAGGDRRGDGLACGLRDRGGGARTIQAPGCATSRPIRRNGIGNQVFGDRRAIFRCRPLACPKCPLSAFAPRPVRRAAPIRRRCRSSRRRVRAREVTSAEQASAEGGNRVRDVSVLSHPVLSA
jgi:hypothetical protein